MLAERVVGTETQNLTEDQGLEEQTDAENPKKKIHDRLQSVYEGEFCKFHLDFSLAF